MKTTKDLTAVLDAAYTYTSKKYFVVPIPEGRNELLTKGWSDLRLEEKDLPERFKDGDSIGLLLQPSGLTDVDCDCPQAVAAARTLLPPTGMVHGHLSNPHSHHYYRQSSISATKQFQDPCLVTKNDRERAMLVEFRVNGQTVVPPSINQKSGEPVEWESDGEPADVDGAELSRLVGQVAAVALLARYWRQGLRHNATLALAGMLLRSGWSQDETERFVLAICSAAHDEELDSRLQDIKSTAEQIKDEEPATGAPTLAGIFGEDIVKKVREWLKLPRALAEQHHSSDLGNARRLVSMHGCNLHYFHSSKKWLVWNDSRWAFDETGEVERLAKDTVDSIYKEAVQLSGDPRQALIKHALKSEDDRRIRAMVSLARSEEGIPVISSEMDANQWILNCTNGTLDLHTGELLPHTRQDLCTKQVPVAYDPNAPCPVWNQFLNTIMNGDQALVEYLQRIVGYSLTGSTQEQALFIPYGSGANGKSTFTQAILGMLGDYGKKANFDTFLTSKMKSKGVGNDWARLAGARFVAAVEAEEGERLAEAIIKQATGCDTIVARFLYQENFEFEPQFKLWLATNHKPIIRGSDKAIWRRIRLIPFTVTISDDKQDKNLLQKLMVESPGILAWAVRGCVQWQQVGLLEPKAVLEATAGYREEMDVIADFIGDRCFIEGGEWVSSRQLFREWKGWCEDNGEWVGSKKAFGSRLADRNFKKGKQRGQRGWVGIGMRSEFEGERNSILENFEEVAD
jgi:P4 family phage/plasmid primase-like protien